MNIIDEQCQQIKAANKLGLMAHVVLGYPNMEESRKLILALTQEGIDFLELQIPFSDPLGDGPVIRKANAAALANGFKIVQAFELVKKLRQDDGIKIPLLFMTYFNIVFNYGVERFCQQAANAGIDGLIIPDYPMTAEGHDHLNQYCRQNGLYLIKFLSLDSSSEQILRVGQSAQGFVYCFAQRGVTGVREELVSELFGFLERARLQISCPLAVGFGVSNAAQARELKNKADIVIVGSALLEAYNSGGVEGVREKARGLA